MDKITQNINFQNNIVALKKNDKIAFKGDEDEFMKSNPKKEFTEKAIKHLANFGCENIAYALWDCAAWTNRVDYICPIYDEEWEVVSMLVGVLNLETGEYNTCSYSKKELIKLVKDIRDKFPDKPHDEEAFNLYYPKFVEKFEKFDRYK